MESCRLGTRSRSTIWRRNRINKRDRRILHVFKGSENLLEEIGLRARELVREFSRRGRSPGVMGCS